MELELETFQREGGVGELKPQPLSFHPPLPKQNHPRNPQDPLKNFYKEDYPELRLNYEVTEGSFS